MIVELPKKIEDKIRRKTLTLIYDQRPDAEFVNTFRTLFSEQYGKPVAYCGDCQTVFPTMTELTKHEYANAKHDRILLCRVCGRQSSVVRDHEIPKIKIILGILTLIVFSLLMAFVYWTTMVG